MHGNILLAYLYKGGLKKINKKVIGENCCLILHSYPLSNLLTVSYIFVDNTNTGIGSDWIRRSDNWLMRES